MAGGMGRPGANIGAGLPQAGGQQQAQANAPMPIFNAPAISPMQQYMQSIGINRMGYNPQALANQGYGAARAPQNFQPQLRPQVAAQAQPQQQSQAQVDADAVRAYQAMMANGGNGGNG